MIAISFSDLVHSTLSVRIVFLCMAFPKQHPLANANIAVAIAALQLFGWYDGVQSVAAVGVYKTPKIFQFNIAITMGGLK